jgi:hypothetical protein
VFPIESVGWEMCIRVQEKKVDGHFSCMFLAILVEVLTTSMVDLGG